jgi:DNA-binding SARP family transcriptional activator
MLWVTAPELVQLAPYRETGHALRMRALAAAGNTAEALLAFDSLCHLLRDDLGVSPSPDLRALHQELLSRS